MGGSLSAAAKLKLERQFQQIQQNRPTNWKIIRQSDSIWDIWITTGIETPFHSIPFKVTVNFPNDYPNSRPILKIQNYGRFFHPNIDMSDGSICEKTLDKTQVSVRERVDALVRLFQIPNPYSPLNSDAADKYKNKFHQYYSQALYRFRGYA